MTDYSRDFSFDLDDLDQLVSRADGFIGFLTDSLDGIDQRIAAIQQTWHGKAADAQHQAYQEWAPGAAEVVEGLTTMHAAIRTARTAYQEAQDINLRMSGG
ncbi:WXG100 family type VII secretion target [Nocardia africana]|uniref:ESAT-6-like protein n=1 Tax=Nocardia africana TaxID=134964 RepID=A0A378WHQ9_9NOCA|nr:WXG100 family type VII secretion target [Nocardia africana]MCC3318093.1 WXG100 family type VII secretion target [Nocardia africana]SUA40820.1 Uncharacterized protein conserved in bacteria [Nocardia africana]